MPWACTRCGTLHTQNPSDCRECGHRIFTSVSREEAGQRSEGIEGPDPLSDDEILSMGTEPDPEFESSPDLNPDGSIKTESKVESTSETLRRWLAFLRDIPKKVVDTIRTIL